MISNMVKALHPTANKEIDPFYFKAFQKLDRLSKLQLIVCPDSEFHEDESIFSKYPKEHKRVYELLSHGISYEDRWTILRFEVAEHLDNWLLGRPAWDTSYTVHDFIHGNINAWQGRILITVNSQRMEMAKEGLKNVKNKTFEILKDVFDRWQSERGKNFDYWYQGELSQWKWNIVDGYKKQFRIMVEAMAGVGNHDPLSIFPTPFYLIFDEVSKKLHEKFPIQEEYNQKLNEFLESKSLENVPFMRILSMIMAQLAHRISSGNMNKDKIKASFYTDATMVATLLPFFDAIFLEKQMAGFLKDNPLKTAISRMPKIFSLANQNDFLAYLDEIEKSASKEHLDAVKEVYGEDWGQPYETILNEFK